MSEHHDDAANDTIGDAKIAHREKLCQLLLDSSSGDRVLAKRLYVGGIFRRHVASGLAKSVVK